MFDVYVTLTDQYVGTYCDYCLMVVKEANDHIDLTMETNSQAHCELCGGTAGSKAGTAGQ